jgi:hypothetical protein
MPTPPKALAEAYAGWLDAQQQALALMTSLEQPGTDQDWAEGYRWLTRMASLCQDWLLEKEDPLRPTIFRNQDAYRKLIVDNPDVNYWFVAVRPEHVYRLYGNRGTAPYLGFTIGTDVLRGRRGTSTLAQLHRPVRGRRTATGDRRGGRAPAGHTVISWRCLRAPHRSRARPSNRTQRPATLDRAPRCAAPPRAPSPTIASCARCRVTSS